MRRVVLGVVGVMAAGAGHAAETYSFTTVVRNMWWYQTLVHCTYPAKPVGKRIPTGCILSEPAFGFPNLRSLRSRSFYPGVACAAGQPIEFHPNGTLAHCKLDGEQILELKRHGEARHCFDYVWFDENGLADCD